MSFRIGQGYDVHPFKEGIPLWLGGVKIEYSHGLVGHSDADVLLHAICDALLGALALGDIGLHFPDSSEKYEGKDSKVLLQETYKLVVDKAYRLVNLDSTLVLEKPKIKDFIPEIRKTIAGVLDTDISNVSVKATTSEKLGFTGRREGVAAQAVVLLKKS